MLYVYSRLKSVALKQVAKGVDESLREYESVKIMLFLIVKKILIMRNSALKFIVILNKGAQRQLFVSPWL